MPPSFLQSGQPSECRQSVGLVVLVAEHEPHLIGVLVSQHVHVHDIGILIEPHHPVKHVHVLASAEKDPLYGLGLCSFHDLST